MTKLDLQSTVLRQILAQSSPSSHRGAEAKPQSTPDAGYKKGTFSGAAEWAWLGRSGVIEGAPE